MSKIPTAASVESGPCLSPSVADRPLRPATDHSLGGPLPHQPANRTRAPPTPPQSEDQDFGHPRGWHHPVLAAVSRGCPGARGRFPRATHPSATHPEGCVRLACVRRAASVRSEPDQTQLQPPSPKYPGATGTRLQTASLHKAGPKGSPPKGAAQRRPVRMPQTCCPSPPMRHRAPLAPKTARTRPPPAAASAPPPSAEMPEPKAALKPPPTHPFLFFHLVQRSTRQREQAPSSKPGSRDFGQRLGDLRPSPNDRAGMAYVGRVRGGFKPLFRPIDRDRTDRRSTSG